MICPTCDWLYTAHEPVYTAHEPVRRTPRKTTHPLLRRFSKLFFSRIFLGFFSTNSTDAPTEKNLREISPKPAIFVACCNTPPPALDKIGSQIHPRGCFIVARKPIEGGVLSWFGNPSRALSWLGNSCKGVCYRGSEIHSRGCVIVARKFVLGGVLSWLENSSRGVCYQYHASHTELSSRGVC